MILRGRSTDSIESSAPLTTAAPALAVKRLTRRFSGQAVVNDLTFAVGNGEFIALLGPSGCGKTTSLRVIAGLERQDGGTIHIAGTCVASDTVAVAPERRRVGMVFQDYALFPHISVAGNVGYGLRRGTDTRRRIAQVLDLVGLAGADDRSPSELSGGQQQRVALARALAPEPDIVMLDEPFSNLDQQLRVNVRRDVREILRQAGTTAVLVTHDQEEALSLADRIVVMHRGRAEQVGTPEQLYHRPATRFVAEFIGDAQFLRAYARERRAETPLGDVPLVAEAEGAVEVLLRPEHVRLDRMQVEGAAHGRVLSREYFGHDQLLTVGLDRGERIVARLGAYSGIRPGDEVWTSIRGALIAFPVKDSTG